MTSDLRARMEALAARMEPALMGMPPDCHDRCAYGPCVCSGARPVHAWSGVTPDDLRALLAEPAAEDDPAPTADGGEVEALTEALLFGVSGGGVDAGKTFRESIARRLLASDWLADLRRTERAEGAREALLAAARELPGFDSIRTHGDAAKWLRARAATEPTTDRPGDGVEVREVGGRG